MTSAVADLRCTVHWAGKGTGCRDLRDTPTGGCNYKYLRYRRPTAWRAMWFWIYRNIGALWYSANRNESSCMRTDRVRHQTVRMLSGAGRWCRHADSARCRVSFCLSITGTAQKYQHALHLSVCLLRTAQYPLHCPLFSIKSVHLYIIFHMFNGFFTARRYADGINLS